MVSLYLHSEAIKAAIGAALDAGLEVEVGLTYDSRDGSVIRIEVDLWDGPGSNYINVFTEDRT